MVKRTMNKSGHKREMHECYRTQPFKINMFTLHVAINEYSFFFHEAGWENREEREVEVARTNSKGYGEQTLRTSLLLRLLTSQLKRGLR